MFTIDPGNYIPFLLVIFLSLVKPSVELLSNFEKVRDNKRQAKLDFALCHFFRFGVSFFGKDPIYRTKVIVRKPVWTPTRPTYPIT
jgi:hypothetical protein